MEKLLKHISKGESEFIEFKTSFNKETIETLVAFSNAKGGEVFIGVSDIKEIHEGFKVVLFKEKLNDPLNDPLNERQKTIVKILKKVSNSTYEQLADQCNVSVKTIKRDLKKLQDLNIIKRVGSKKTGYWQLTK